ncbi:MAG: PASTA domain-containing protein, partial [Flavobacteriales bacterium]
SIGEWMKANTSQTEVELSAADPISGQVPNVLGMGLQDALFLLERSGLRVQVVGYGTVKKQSIPAGNSIVGNSPIIIELAS